MILKRKDDVTSHLVKLESLLERPEINEGQRHSLKAEIWAMRTGHQGERDAAYHIDFHWKNGLNSAVIHDLRIEQGGRSAQIDHLILTRSLNFHVLETKNLSREVRISKLGEWEMQTASGWQGMASPIEQNRRHIEVLREYIREHQLAPKRLGFTLPVRFQNWVLVSPQCRVKRQGSDGGRVVKMDMFERRIGEWIDRSSFLDTVTSISSFVSRKTVQNIGLALVGAHRPQVFPYAQKFGFHRSIPAACICANCGDELDQRVIDYCRTHAKKFGGKHLCRLCQSSVSLPACEKCQTEVDEKVVTYCRLHATRVGGRLLCRSCQAISAAA